jgi:hypothetical protein
MDKSEIEVQEGKESIKTHRFNRLNALYRSFLLTLVALVAITEFLSNLTW